MHNPTPTLLGTQIEDGILWEIKKNIYHVHGQGYVMGRKVNQEMAILSALGKLLSLSNIVFFIIQDHYNNKYTK